MSWKTRTVIVVEALLVLMIASIHIAHAAPKGYIDPATGGMLFQVLAVIVTMASGVIFLFSNKIKMFFNRGGQNTDTMVEDTDELLINMDDVVGDEIVGELDDAEDKISPVVK